MNKIVNKDPAIIREYFIKEGYNLYNPSMTIDADIVMNFMGEDVRNRLLLSNSPDGKEICLRPDFTLPLAISYKNNEIHENKYVYDGYAFRFPTKNEKTRSCPEFRQIGIENFGSEKKIESEVEIISHVFEVLSDFSGFDLRITISDVSIFYQFLKNLNLSKYLFNKIIRLYWNGLDNVEIKDAIQTLINRQFEAENQEDLIAQYKNGSLSSIRFIESLLGEENISIFSGRDPDEIVNNYLDKLESNNLSEIDQKTINQISEFLSITGDINSCITELSKFEDNYTLDLKNSIVELENRIKYLKDINIPLNNIQFKTTLSRKAEYYTGLIFEINNTKTPISDPIAIGGRYDKIFEELGSTKPIPAVGCSIYVDRLLYSGKLDG